MKKNKRFISGIISIIMTLSTLFSSIDSFEIVRATDEISAKKVYGDLNEDGKINIFDLMHLKNILLNGDTNNKTLKYADVDGDGETSFKDISEMVKYLMNEIGIFEPELELDSDNDGLCDYFEQLFGTDIMNPDSDSDGLSDYEEAFITCTDPLKEDSSGDGVNDSLSDNDNDGLSNIDEIKNNTDPNIADSDNDNINDVDEIKLGSNPLKADSDDDNISDYGESKLGTIPSEQCSDGITPDNKRYFEQIMDDEYLSDINTFDNCYSLKVSANMAGYIGEEIVIKESGYSNFLSNNNIYGRIIDIDYIRDYDNIFDIDDFTYTLSFCLDNSLNPDDYMIFYYAVDDYILVPFDTNINENVLSISYNVPATFCLVNISNSSNTFSNEIIDTSSTEESANGAISNGVAYQVANFPKPMASISYYFEVSDFNIKGWFSNPELRNSILDSAAQLESDNYSLYINMIFYGKANYYSLTGGYQVTINCTSWADINDVFSSADAFFSNNINDVNTAKTIYNNIVNNSARPNAYNLQYGLGDYTPNLSDEPTTNFLFCVGNVSAPYDMRVGFMNFKVNGPDIKDYEICLKSNITATDKIYTLAKKRKNKIYTNIPFLGFMYLGDTTDDIKYNESILNYLSNNSSGHLDYNHDPIAAKIASNFSKAPTILDVISKNNKTFQGTAQYAEKMGIDLTSIEICSYIPWTAKPGTNDADGDGIEDYMDYDPRNKFDGRFAIAEKVNPLTMLNSIQKNINDAASIYAVDPITSEHIATHQSAYVLTLAPYIYPLASEFLRHYLGGSGELIYYSPYSYITNTVRGPRKMADYLNLIREISEETVKDTALCFNSTPDADFTIVDLSDSNQDVPFESELATYYKNYKNNDVIKIGNNYYNVEANYDKSVQTALNKYCVTNNTENYHVAIGSCSGTIGFKCERLQTNVYTAEIEMKLLDFYDFSDSEERVIFPTVTDGKLYALHRCGLAKAFYTIGTLKFKMTWTRGERLGQNMNDMEKVRSYLLKDDRTNVA